MSTLGSARQWIAGAVVIVLAAILVGARRIASWDVWWHLAIGRDAVRTGSTLPLDTWSYSFEGAPFVHKDLVGDLVLYGAFEALGYPGLVLLRALVVITLAAALWLATPRRARDPVSWFAAALLLIIAVQSRIIPRPLMFTVALFPLMLALLERARAHLGDVRGFVRAHLPILALQWLWLLLHRGGLLGLVLLLGHACALALAVALHRAPAFRAAAGPRPAPPVVGAAFGLFAAAVLIGLANPSGLTLYTSALSVTHDDIHRTGITEWAPLTWELAETIHPVATLLIATAIGLVVGRLGIALIERDRPSPVHVWHLGVLLLFTWQGIQSMRWLSYASGTAALCVALISADWALTRGTSFRPRGLMTILGFLGLGLLHLLNPGIVGVGPLPNRYPEAALAFADEHDLGDDVHNAFVYGGYVIWHADGAHRVLVDGRNDMLYPSAFFDRCSRAQRDPQEFAALQAEHPTTWVLSENVPGRESFAFLWSDPEWAPVFWSDPAVVWIRTDAYPELAASQFRLLDPSFPTPSLQAALQRFGDDEAAHAQLRRELERMLTASPTSLRALTTAALYFDHVGDVARRDELAAMLMRHHGDHPVAQQLPSLFRSP